MTTEIGGRDHREIAELLPDYILGALPDGELRRVAGHLDGCAQCRAELDDALGTSSLLFDAGPVNPAIRAALVTRLSSDVATPVWTVPSESLTALPAVEPPPARSEARPTPLFGPVTRLCVAVAAAILIALGGWVALDRLGDDGGERIAELTGNPAFAHVLADSEAGSRATGTMYVDPTDDQAYIDATGLSPLPEGYGYQVWLFDETGRQVSAGFFPVDEDGGGAALVTAPQPFESFWAVGLSAEPLTGSASPTSPLALGGWIR